MQASPKRSLSSVLCYISHEVARGLSRSQGSDDVPLLAWIASGDAAARRCGWVFFFLATGSFHVSCMPRLLQIPLRILDPVSFSFSFSLAVSLLTSTQGVPCV